MIVNSVKHFAVFMLMPIPSVHCWTTVWSRL